VTSRVVAYLGPAGTYTEEALRAGATERAELLPVPTVHDAVEAVRRGRAARAVVPLENSLEGGVGATLDALANQAEEVRIVGETVLAIRHCLIARTGTELDTVERVISHPQALAQCANFLRDRLPAAEPVAAPSTADAVRAVSEGPGGVAALGSNLSAELYGCVVLADAVQDRADNLTRFAWLASAGEELARPPGANKTSIVFWGFNDESPGALVDILRELSDRSINLTRIESRPRRVRLGHYMFFADLDGHEHDPPVREALRGLRKRVQTLRVLGSYTTADTDSR